MKSIKFSNSDHAQKQFASAVRKNVADWFAEKGISNKANVSMWVKAVAMLSIYLAPFILLLLVPMPIGIAVLMVVIIGTGKAGIGMSVMHDGAHGAFSRHTWVNRMFASTIYLLGSNPFNWKVQHNILHHTFTNIYGLDQDIDSKAALRLCSNAPLKKFHRYQYIYAYFFYSLMTIARMGSDFSHLAKYTKAGISKDQNVGHGSEIARLILVKVVYLSICLGLPLYFTAYNFWQILAGFAIVHLTAGLIMSIIFQLAHVVEGLEEPIPDTNGLVENEWMVHELYTTADFAPNNFLLNWYVGGLNFQIEHHLFPNTCHVHYRSIAPIVQKTALEFGLVYHIKPTFSNAMASHARKLWQLGRA